MRLVRDDVPVRGRVVDSRGRPVAGVVVRVRAIWEINDRVDLDADTFEVGGLEPGQPRLLVFMHKASKLVGAAVLTDEDLKSNAGWRSSSSPRARSRDGSSTTMACRGRGLRSMSGCPTRTGPRA